MVTFSTHGVSSFLLASGAVADWPFIEYTGLLVFSCQVTSPLSAHYHTNPHRAQLPNLARILHGVRVVGMRSCIVH